MKKVYLGNSERNLMISKNKKVENSKSYLINSKNENSNFLKNSYDNYNFNEFINKSSNCSNLRNVSGNISDIYLPAILDNYHKTASKILKNIKLIKNSTLENSNTGFNDNIELSLALVDSK
jgi:hypothetical protein